MADFIELKATDLAAMLCSRVCHDLINPVGAIGNGLEVLADPSQAAMAEGAHELIANSAKHKAKLLMNMLLIAAMAVPRGGVVTVELSGAAGEEAFKFTSKSDPEKRQKTLMPSGAEGLLSGAPADGVDARGIQPFYTGILARMTDMDLKIGIENDIFVLSATPKAKVAD